MAGEAPEDQAAARSTASVPRRLYADIGRHRRHAKALDRHLYGVPPLPWWMEYADWADPAWLRLADLAVAS